jgi:hypothetical protein
MKKSKAINYDAYILCNENRRYGVFALHGSELCIAAPLKYHAIGLQILQAMNPTTMIFAEVFSFNPALKVYLDNDFHVNGVKEKYCKKNDRWISVIILSWMSKY